MKRVLTLADSLRARAFLVRARLDAADVEALAGHLAAGDFKRSQLPLRLFYLHPSTAALKASAELDALN